MMKTLVAVLAVLGALALGAKADVQIGEVSVSDAAAAFGEVSELVCGVFETMQFEPVDWSGEVASAYETEGSTLELSLQELAQGAAFGDDIPEVWADYQEFFGDDTWLDTNVLEGIEAPDNESDGARIELTAKSARDANGVAHVLALIEAAEAALEGGDEDTALLFMEAAWVIYHGYDNGDGDDGTGCAPYGTGESRSGNFGLAGDVTERIVEAFEAAQSDLSEETLEALFAEVQKSTLITYLRAAVRYAARMDSNAEDEDPGNLRVNQLEGLAFFRVVEPYAASLDADAAEIIDSTFAVTEYPPDADGNIDISEYEEVGESVLEAAEAILEAAGIDIESEFGELE